MHVTTAIWQDSQLKVQCLVKGRCPFELHHRGALAGACFSVWQDKHERASFSKSLSNPGHQKWLLTMAFIRVTPGWLVYGLLPIEHFVILMELLHDSPNQTISFQYKFIFMQEVWFQWFRNGLWPTLTCIRNNFADNRVASTCHSYISTSHREW